MAPGADIAAFTGVALLASWAWTWPLVATGSTVEKGVGWPTHFPALLGPALAAFVVTAWLAGRPGVAALAALASAAALVGSSPQPARVPGARARDRRGTRSTT